MKYFYPLIFFLLLTSFTNAQLKPGFDANEYLEMLRISRQQFKDTLKGDPTPLPGQYRIIYRSPEGPLKNRWELWVNTKGTAVISIRGTTKSDASWLENFYAAMVPASGQLHIDNSTTFKYHLANDPRAGVHIGWLLGLADLSKTIVPKIIWLNEAKGYKNFIIMGHSQGAAIAYLLRSYLADLQATQLLSNNITFKTYCSAPPKPGNGYYAYDYDYLTRGGWGISVRNTADWVPETPFSIQTLNDFSSPNPYTNTDEVTKKQIFFKEIYLDHYSQLKKKPEKAQQANEKYLGAQVYVLMKKYLPKFTEPVYLHDNNYTSCGSQVVLMPDKDYRSKFQSDPKNVFVHHMFWAYYYLTQKEYLNQQ